MVNPYVSLTFLVLVGVMAVAYRVLGRFGPPWSRAVALAAISALLLYRLPDGSTFLPYALAYAAAMALIAWTLSRIATSASRTSLLVAAVALALVVMLVFRYPTYTAALAGDWPLLRDFGLVPFLGLSYMTFPALDYPARRGDFCCLRACRARRRPGRASRVRWSSQVSETAVRYTKNRRPMVQNGKFADCAEWDFVSALNIVDLPTLGNPTIPHCKASRHFSDLK